MNKMMTENSTMFLLKQVENKLVTLFWKLLPCVGTIERLGKILKCTDELDQFNWVVADFSGTPLCELQLFYCVFLLF